MPDGPSSWEKDMRVALGRALRPTGCVSGFEGVQASCLSLMGPGTPAPPPTTEGVGSYLPTSVSQPGVGLGCWRSSIPALFLQTKACAEVQHVKRLYRVAEARVTLCHLLREKRLRQHRSLVRVFVPYTRITVELGASTDKNSSSAYPRGSRPELERSPGGLSVAGML